MVDGSAQMDEVLADLVTTPTCSCLPQVKQFLSVACLIAAKMTFFFPHMGAKNSKVSTRDDDDEHFMIIAEVSAERSEDPSRRVGCCIVDDERRIISTGFNSMPRGCDDFSWSKEGMWIDTKYPYVCHAEADVILNGKRSMKDGTLYTTLFPCNECAKLIIQSGIRQVKYMDSKDDVSASAARRMFDASDVRCTLIVPARKAILVSRETKCERL